MSQQLVGVNLGAAHTVPEAALGTEHVDASGNHFIYMQADGAVVAYELMSYDAATWQIEDQADAAVTPADTGSESLCVCSFALADNEYGWAFVGPGQAVVKTDSTGVTAADIILYVSATAGTVSSGATAALLKGAHADAVIAGGATGTIVFTNRIWSEDLP